MRKEGAVKGVRLDMGANFARCAEFVQIPNSNDQIPMKFQISDFKFQNRKALLDSRGFYMSWLMRVVILLMFALGLCGCASSTRPEPPVPLASQAVSYEWRLRHLRCEPEEIRKLSKECGDVLLKLLDGGHTLRAPKPPSRRWPPSVPVRDPRALIHVTLDNGTTYQIRLQSNGGMVVLPDTLQGIRIERWYIINEAMVPKVRQWMAELDADLLREIMSAPRPWSYRIGTLFTDDCKLSGVARLFYGDASKWPVIYEANKAIIQNPPHDVPFDAVLTIP